MPLGDRRLRYFSEQQLHRRLLDPGVRVQRASFHRVRVLRVGEHEFRRDADKRDHRGQCVRVQVVQNVQAVPGHRVRARSTRGESRAGFERFAGRVRVQYHISDDRGRAKLGLLFRPTLLVHRELLHVWRLRVSTFAFGFTLSLIH